MTEVAEIETLAGVVRAGLDADDRKTRAERPRLCPACQQPIIQQDSAKLLDGTTYGCGHYFTWDQVFDHAERINGETTDALRRAARDRAMVDLLLAEKHHVAEDQWYTCPAATRERDGGTYAETDGGGRCTCGRDARVAAYLTLLAQPYTEAS